MQAAAVKAGAVIPLVDMLRSGDKNLCEMATAILCGMAKGQEHVRLKLDQEGILTQNMVTALAGQSMNVNDDTPPKCNPDLSLDVSPYWQCKTCGVEGEFCCQDSEICSSFGVGVNPDPLWHGWRDILAIAGGSCFGLFAFGVGVVLEMDISILAALALSGFVLSIALGGAIYTMCMSAAGRHCCLCSRARKWGTILCEQCVYRQADFVDLQRRGVNRDDGRGWGTVLTAFIVQSIDFMSDMAVIIVWAADKSSPLRSILFQLGGFSVGVVLAINMYACMLFLDTSMQIRIWLSKYSNFKRNMILTLVVMALSSVHLHVVFIGMNSDFGPHKEMFLLKGLQTGLESLPMALFMMLDMVSESTHGNISFVTLSSLMLSLLSVVYSCCCCVFQWYDDDKKRVVHTVQGNVVWGWVPAMQLFLFCLLDFTASLAIYAILISMWTKDWRIPLIPAIAVVLQMFTAFLCFRMVWVGFVRFVWDATTLRKSGDSTSQRWKNTHFLINLMVLWPLRASLCAFLALLLWFTSIPGFVIDLRIFLPGSKNISIRMMNVHAIFRRLVLFTLSVLVVELQPEVGRQFYYLFGLFWCFHTYLSLQVFYYLGQIDLNMDSLLARSTRACFRWRGASIVTVGVDSDSMLDSGTPVACLQECKKMAIVSRKFKFECFDRIPQWIFECGSDLCTLEHHQWRDTVQRFIDVSEAVLWSLAEISEGPFDNLKTSCSCLKPSDDQSHQESQQTLEATVTQCHNFLYDDSCHFLVNHLIERAVDIIVLSESDRDRLLTGTMARKLDLQLHYDRDKLIDRVADVLEEYNPSAEQSEFRNNVLQELRLLNIGSHGNVSNSLPSLQADADGLAELGRLRVELGEPMLRKKSRRQFQPYHQRGESNLSRISEQDQLAGKLTGRRLWESDELRVLPISKAINIELWQSKIGSRLSSMLSVPAESCSTFISHSWSDNGKDKFYLLRKQLVLHKFDSTVLIVSIVVGLNMVTVGFMIQELSHSTAQVWWVPPIMCLSAGLLLSLWAHASGTWLPATFGPLSFSRTTVWLDKCCIDQTDDNTKQAGIANLGLHLMQCESMTVLLGPTYLSRLWTTFELATYCRELHNRKEDVKEKLHFLSLEWRQNSNNLLWLLRGIELSPGEVKSLATYSCRDARCFLPKDRVTVLREIRRKWGSEEAFDHFVRTKLPGVLLSGKERYFHRFSHTFMETLSYIF